MSILVTGATGPLGAAICRLLIARGDTVHGAGRRADAFPDLPTPHFRPIVADLTDPLACAHAMNGCRAVIHCAALSSPWGKTADFWHQNVVATANLLAVAKRNCIKRFVFVSSASVTFTGHDALDVTEDTPYPDRWLCAYSASKAAAEIRVRTAGLSYAILRPRAIYGPGDRVLLPRILALARQRRLRRMRRRDVRQSLTAMDNIAHACVLALDHTAIGTWNVADEEPVWLWATIDHALSQVGLGPAKSGLPAPLVCAVGAGLEWSHRFLPILGEPPLTRYTAALMTCDQTLSLTAIRHDLGYRAVCSGDQALARAMTALRDVS